MFALNDIAGKYRKVIGNEIRVDYSYSVGI